ncbi:homeobox-leucine zipper protein ATHB-7-like isoform X2 [Cynara cardunculus var. scolymus]|uniref:homeobox-leucine zipper protein ATHB-7-like isoform X2 n=1 Tax=Cynara cardunculus var. scolymus TaxID=59895 RepID=UPI000D62D712|nr:homeobox-leucine zipper protein ATHB-7-like isoform X2 [Cynara cardunculus var. scolymus]
MMSAVKTRKNKDEGRSRFSNEQIQFLEYMFETQSRPELRTKQQLANKLGLHPRQVAIWFQNRRARSKSRQTEQEYNLLKHDYEALACKSESLKEENQSLLTQMLRDLAKTQQGNITMRPDFANKSSNENFDDKITLSMADNSKVLSENDNQEIHVPFYGDTSYVGEDGKIIETEEHKSRSDSDRPSWWEF